MITNRDIGVLGALDRYFVLNRPQIQKLCFPEDLTGRVTRRRLNALVRERFISRHPVEAYVSRNGSTGPAYFPSQRGSELLAGFFGDDKYLVATTQQPQSHHLLHWLAVSETHLALDAAIALQSEVAVLGWINEWDVVNREESVPENRFRLYSLLRDKPRLVCAPDAAFLLEARGVRKVFYLEQDRGTSGVFQIAASKSPGYAEMANRKQHFKHFPASTLDGFTVILVAPNTGRRDLLRRAIKGKPKSEIWRFVSATDLSPETFLTTPVFYSIDAGPVPLVSLSPLLTRNSETEVTDPGFPSVIKPASDLTTLLQLPGESTHRLTSQDIPLSTAKANENQR